jgi:hypothetical protein
MIELLLSLALLVLLTGFLAGGLAMGRRAFGADQAAGIGSETDAAMEVVSRLIGSALPLSFGEQGRGGMVAFDGRGGTLSFVGLSEGHALRGGPHRFSLRRNGGDLVVDVASAAVGTNQDGRQPPLASAVVLTGVRTVRFGYFGRQNPGAPAGWRAEWVRSDHLPDLVSVQIDFEDERRNEPAILVALRQG